MAALKVHFPGLHVRHGGIIATHTTAIFYAATAPAVSARLCVRGLSCPTRLRQPELIVKGKRRERSSDIRTTTYIGKTTSTLEKHSVPPICSHSESAVVRRINSRPPAPPSPRSQILEWPASRPFP